ncbi:reverse transcriptase [Gossypium australe]|uniref:Reverse transcriptase n=1 Tax=Gossypium australe TaxID=47621 RepID=A0A5B6WQI2_9ROSI|nr:reverse transcriptase [Gossypium australe]
MPYKMFKQLGIGESKPIRMSIQLADRSIKYPRGIIEDVLVKVDKFIFPINFVILDMDEDIEVPMILETTRTVIDVGNGELVLRVGDEEVTLQVHEFVKVSNEQNDTHFSDNVSNHATQHSLQEITHEYVLE